MIFRDNEEELQKLLDVVHNWTTRWRMLINYDKTKIVHFCPRNMLRSQVNFKCGEKHIQFAESYRYLGCELDEYLDFTHTSRVLAEASGRSLGSAVNKHKLCGGMYYELYI